MRDLEVLSSPSLEEPTGGDTATPEEKEEEEEEDMCGTRNDVRDTSTA